MAVITVTIPDAINDSMIEAFCAKYNYQPEVLDGSGNFIPNPVSSGQFTETVFIGFGKEVIKAYQTEKAAHQAREQVAAAVDNTFSQAVITINVQ